MMRYKNAFSNTSLRLCLCVWESVCGMCFYSSMFQLRSYPVLPFGSGVVHAEGSSRRFARLPAVRQQPTPEYQNIAAKQKWCAAVKKCTSITILPQLWLRALGLRFRLLAFRCLTFLFFNGCLFLSAIYIYMPCRLLVSNLARPP